MAMDQLVSVGHLSTEYLSRSQHHVVPSATATDTDTDDRFTYHLSAPTPFTPLQEGLPSTVLNGIDPAISLVKMKIKWELRKEKLLKSIRADKKTKGREWGRSGNRKVVGRGISMLARHLDADPDPAFTDSVYNWYYTGGTLATMRLHGEHYLLYPSSTGGEVNVCEAETEKCRSPIAVPLGCSDPVFQIVTDSKEWAAVRQRERVTVLLPGEDGALRVGAAADGRFVSTALQPDSASPRFSTLDTRGHLRLWHIERRGTCEREAELDGGERSKGWGHLAFCDHNTLLHANRTSVHLYDIRAGGEGSPSQRSWRVCDQLESCQQLTLLVTHPHSQSEHFYAATSHQLLMLDYRSGVNLQCWTHMLASPPYLGCVHSMENNSELVCLGGQSAGDSVVVGEAVGGVRLLPSPQASLLSQRRKGHCLHPGLLARSRMSQIGLAAVRLPGDSLRVFRQSSGTGDVFSQDIAPPTPRPDSGGWGDGEEIQTQPQSAPVHVTHVADFRPLLAALTRKDPPSLAVPQRSSLSASGLKVSKKYLEDCRNVDIMAENLLKVWQIEDEEEWLEEGVGEEEEDPDDRVISWLGGAPDTIKLEPDFDSASIEDIPPRRKLKKTQSPEVKAVPSTVTKSMDFNESVFSVTHAKPAIVTNKVKPVPTSVKKKFVPGF